MGDMKPCPFCGGKAEVFMGNYWAWGRCTKCGTQAKMIKIDDGNKEKAKQEITEFWNKRVDDAYKQR